MKAWIKQDTTKYRIDPGLGGKKGKNCEKYLSLNQHGGWPGEKKT